jgi:ComF family protein
MSLMEAAIELLAPPQCINCQAEGSSLCESCATAYIKPFGERCWRCNSLSPRARTCDSCRYTGSPRRAWIVTDHDGLARDLLSLYKFGHQRAAAEPITDLMIKELLKYHDLADLNYLIVPIPTATSRIRQRSFGHSELLAKKLSTKLKLPYLNCLRRLDQARQLGASRETRLKQLNSSFAAKYERSINGQSILLIDDVVTTGGTVIAATKTLRAAGARQVDALIFAKRL